MSRDRFGVVAMVLLPTESESSERHSQGRTSEEAKQLKTQSSSGNRGVPRFGWGVRLSDGQIRGPNMDGPDFLLTKWDLILRQGGGQKQKSALVPMPVRPERG